MDAFVLLGVYLRPQRVVAVHYYHRPFPVWDRLVAHVAVLPVLWCERPVFVPDDFFGLMAGGGQPSRLGQISLARLVVASQLHGQVTGPQGQCAPKRGEVGIQVLDLLIPRWPKPGPQ